MNLIRKAYTKAVSQRSRGCVASDGGQTCPFFCAVDVLGADFIDDGEVDKWKVEMVRGEDSGGGGSEKK